MSRLWRIHCVCRQQLQYLKGCRMHKASTMDSSCISNSPRNRNSGFNLALQCRPLSLSMYYNNNDRRSQSNDSRHIEELKEMFKDDPQLEVWLKELSTANVSQEKDSLHIESSREIEDKEQVDVDRELLRYNIEEFYSVSYEEESVQSDDDIEQESEAQLPISKERGEHGVFDVEELVELLRIENGKDICVIRVPASKTYVDYMVLVTGRSLRQLKAMAFYIKWIYKLKRSSGDPKSVDIEGLESNDWLAMDLGNIALHLMLGQTREKYDIETLWAVGPKYDNKLAEEKDPFEDLFVIKDDLEPSESEGQMKAGDLLQLSQNAEYVYEVEEKSSVEHKFNRRANEGMESKTDWHGVDKTG